MNINPQTKVGLLHKIHIRDELKVPVASGTNNVL